MNKSLGILMFFAGLINIAIGIFVFKKNPKNILNKIFAGWGVAIGLWNLDLAGLYYTTSFKFANLWSVILRPAIFMGVAIFFHFSVALSKSFSKINRQLIKVAYTIAVLLSISNWVGIGRKNVVLKEFGYFPQIDITYIIFSICFIVFFSYGLYLIFKRYKITMNPVEKNQLKYFWGAFFIMILISATNLLQVFNVKVYPLGNFSTLIYSGIISYAIVKHELLDIKIVIKRSVIYLVLATFVTVTYISSIFLFQLILGVTSGVNFLFSAILSGLIISITLEPLKNIFDKLTDKIFFKTKYNHQFILNEITDSISSITNIEDLKRQINDILVKYLHIENVIFLFKEDSSNNPVVIFLEEKNELVIYDEADTDLSDEVKKEMESNNMMVCLPLSLKKNFAGVICIGNKKSEDIFSMDDLTLLETISREISMVLENIKLYNEFQRKEKLITIGTMASSLSHEIKNPLTSISTFVQLLPRKYNDESFIKEFDRIVPAEIERLRMLSENLLLFAKPSTKIEKVDINGLIRKTINLIENQFRKKKVKIISELNLIPEIAGDSSELFQVFMNISLNALESLDKQESGYLKISTGLNNGNIEIKFEDNGTGIKNQDIKKIFEPFFTTKEKGTGLGLPICSRIIDSYNGTIKVESMSEKGSIFNVLLPKNG